MHYLFFVLLAPFANGDTDWRYFQEDLELKLRHQMASVAETGETYLINLKQASIVKLSPEGEKITEFSQRGQAPGEMEFPNRIYTYDDTVYVYDRKRRSMHLFDTDGNFKKEQSFGGSLTELVKTKAGWLSYERFRHGRLKGYSVLKWHDETFETDVVLAEIEPETMAEETQDQMYQGYLPARDRIRFGVADHGQKIIVVHPGHQIKIAIHDGSTGILLQTIDRAREPVPYNVAWAEQTIEEYRLKTNRYRRSPRPFSMPEFPDFFPFARQLFVFDDGTFHILPWRRKDSPEAEVLSFDMEGNAIHPLFDHDTLNRLLHLTPTHAWVAIDNSGKKHGGIAKVSRSKLASFMLNEVSANPNSTSQ